jgi:GMP synthase (glutamine-hydrolysing)
MESHRLAPRHALVKIAAMKTALVIRHAPEEDIAGFGEPVEAAGYRIGRIDVSDPGFASLDLAGPDLVVLMGGPMAVYQEDRYPWIAGELERLRQRLALGRPTLGVCLGAQLDAAALGAEVCPGPAKEVGYSTLEIRHPLLRHLEGVPVLHWHGDTFTLPAGAELLASSALYPNQGFRRAANVLALQFHAEMGEDAHFEDWVSRGARYIAAAGTTAEQLRADHARYGPASLVAGRAMLREWLEGLG